MRITKRILAVLLASLMILPIAALTGCAKKQVSASDLAAVNEEVDEIVEMPDAAIADALADTADLSSALSSVTVDTIAFADLGDYKIVHYDSVYAKECATRIQVAIKERTGKTLTVTTDSAAETAKEILVGKTNRSASKELRATYSRPNVCYDIKAVGSKLVVMAEGYSTLKRAGDKFEKYISDNTKTAFVGWVYNCDISPTIDTLGTSMIERATGTNLRAFHWNMAAPLLNNGEAYLKISDVTNNNNRGEIIADIVLQMMPDIITTNEFYYGHAYGQGNLYNAAMKELSEYYAMVGDAELDGCTLEEMTSSTSTTQYQKSTTGHSSYDESKDQPIVGAYASGKVTIPENILYRKNAGFEFIYSGWSYLAEYNANNVNATKNPLGRIYYHGYHTAVFKTTGGKYFAVSVGHYQDNRSKDADASNHMASIEKTITAANKIDSNVTDSISTIITGDMYTSYSNAQSKNNGYKALANAGYVDAQRNATVNANGNISHGTFHDAGIRQIGRISEDFIWTKNNLKALCFKVLTSMDIDYVSDHYPVMADIKFN